jgi:hypothetical protein
VHGGKVEVDQGRSVGINDPVDSFQSVGFVGRVGRVVHDESRILVHLAEGAQRNDALVADVEARQVDQDGLKMRAEADVAAVAVALLEALARRPLLGRGEFSVDSQQP